MAGSTCEAEYIVASEVANEGVWMKEFICDLGVIPSDPMKIFCDNTREPNTSRDASTPSVIKSRRET